MALDNSSISKSSTCFFLQIHRFQEEQRPYVIASCVFNALLFIPNVLGSVLILVTMWKNPNLEMPNHVFLSNLAFADLVTGIVVQPLFILHKTAWMYGHWNMDCIPRVITEIVAWISAAVTCSIIAVISMDRMLALKLHMKYQFYVTRKRAVQVSVFLWLSLTVFSFTRFLTSDIGPFIIIGVCGILLAIVQVFVSYAQIYKYMRHHQKKIAVQSIPAPLESSSTTSTDRNLQLKSVKVKALWKSAMNLGYVVVLYIVVYLPFVGTLIAMLVHGQTTYIDISYDVTRTFLFCASVLNPLIYCWKIKDIKEEVLKTLARLKYSGKFHGDSSGSPNETDIGNNDWRTCDTEIQVAETSIVSTTQL